MAVLDATIANIALPYIGRDSTCPAPTSPDRDRLRAAFGGFLLLGVAWATSTAAALHPRPPISPWPRCWRSGQSEALLLTSRGVQGLAPRSPRRRRRPDHDHLPGCPLPQPRVRGVRGDVRAGCGRRPDPGWLATGLNISLFDPQDGWRLTSDQRPDRLVAALLAPRFLSESKRHSGQLDVPGAIAGTGGLPWSTLTRRERRVRLSTR